MTSQTITLARGALLPALAAAQKAVERRSTIPILQNVLLDAEGERLSITATNLDQEVSTRTTCKTSDPFCTSLPATRLHDAVRKLPDGAEITIAMDGDFATISSGRTRFRLQTLPAADFPRMACEDFTHHFSLPATTLARMLATVGFAMSSEETRYYLNGIHWHVDDAETARFIAVATDGHRLAKQTFPLPEGSAGMPGIILPRQLCGLLKGFAGEEGEISVSLAAHKIRLSAAAGELCETTIVSKLIDGTFPDYTRVVPAGNGNRFKVQRTPAIAAIDRVLTVAGERGRAVAHTFGDDGTLSLRVDNPDAGKAEDSLSSEIQAGSAVEIGFNGRYCLDMLQASPAEDLVFELGDAGAPALVHPDGSTETLFVLMPMRI